MSIFKNFDWSVKSIAKVVGLFLAGIIVLTVVIALFSFSLRTIFQTTDYTRYDDYGRVSKGGFGLEATSFDGAFAPRIGYPPIPEPGFSTGDDAEDYEVKTFNATIKTRKLDETCSQISALKKREDVIFETANVGEESCNFRFKVKKAAEAEIVAFVENLKPENFNENVQSIKRTIESFDKQLEILENKLESVEDTLEKSKIAYDEVAVLATRKSDVETLAKVIDDKLNLINRLTNERIQVKQQIDRYLQNKADSLDKLNFSFFNINVFKDLIFDWKQIKDSWRFEMKAFVQNFNDVVQGISLSLVTYFVRFLQVALYFFLSVFLLKFVWVATKRIWRGKK